MFSSVIIACENNSLSVVCLITFAVCISLTSFEYVNEMTWNGKYVNLLSLAMKNVLNPKKMVGPRAYSCYNGRPARAECPTFLPS